MKKRLIALLLVTVMIVSLLPATVFAADTLIVKDGSKTLATVSYKGGGKQHTKVNFYVNYQLANSCDLYLQNTNDNFVLTPADGYYYGVAGNDYDYSSTSAAQVNTYNGKRITYGVITGDSRVDTINLYLFTYKNGINVDFSRFVDGISVGSNIEKACPSIDISFEYNGRKSAFTVTRFDDLHKSFLPKSTVIYAKPNIQSGYAFDLWLSLDALGDHSNSLYTVMPDGTLSEDVKKTLLFDLPLSEGVRGYSEELAFNYGSGYTEGKIYLRMSSDYYTLSYDANGGTGSVAAQNFRTVAPTVKANGFTYAGMQFDHWNTKRDDSGDSYKPGDEYTKKQDETLYAIWKPILHNLEIEYVISDGKVNAPEKYSQTYAENANYSVKSPTVEGYTADIAEVSGTMGTQDIKKTVTYTANTPAAPTTHKLEIEYVISDGKVDAPEKYSQTYAENANYSVKSPTVEGYTADIVEVSGKMGTQDINETVTYTANDPVIPEPPLPATHTLTVKYILKDSNPEEELAEPTVQNVAEGDTARIDYIEIDGYSHRSGFFTQKMGNVNAVAKLYYTPIAYNITYVLNDGKNADSNPATYTIRDNVVLADASREGYKFDGWFDANDKKVTEIPAGTIGDITLTAKWTQLCPVYVNIYKNGDTSKPVVSQKLGDYPKGMLLTDVLTDAGLLEDISSLYKGNDYGYDWDKKWGPEVQNIKYGIDGRTVNGWTNLCTMVYDIYPVYVNVYANGDKNTAVKSVKLGNCAVGTTYAEILGDAGLLDSLDDLYSSTYGYEWDGKWYHEISNYPNYAIGDTDAVNGWTNLCVMVYNYEKVIVYAVLDGDTENAEKIFEGKAPHGANLFDFLAENVTGLDRDGYERIGRWWKMDTKFLADQYRYTWGFTDADKVNGWTNVAACYKSLIYPVVYFNTVDDWSSYQNVDTRDASQVLLSTQAQKGTLLPTADAPTAERTGYTFKFWSREGQVGTDVTGQTVNGWTNLIGNWEANQYKIIYHSNDGTDRKSTSTVTYDAQAVIKNNANSTKWERPYFEFKGWAETPDGEVKYLGSEKFIYQTAGDTDLYAVWERKIAPLTITKEFAGDLTEDEIASKIESISFTVLRDGEEMEDPVYLEEFEEEDGVYSIEISAYEGYEYELVENDADVEYYDLTADIPDAEILGDDGLTIAVKNTYNRKTAPLTITKEFIGDLTEDEIAEKVGTITFTVLRDGEEMEDPIYLEEFEEKDGVYSIEISAYLGYEYELVENDADVDYYDLTVDIPDAQLLEEDGLTIAVKNTYNRKTALLTITKEFAGDLTEDEIASKIESISFTVLRDGEEMEDPVYLEEFEEEDGVYSIEISAYQGYEYELVENDADVEYYDLTADIPDAQLLEEDGLTIAVKNTYNRKIALLTITKEFAGELTEDEIAEKVESITFTVLRDGEEMEAPVYLEEFEEEDGVYSIDISAYEGYEYELVENDADVDYYDLTADIPNAEILGDDGLTIAVKNTYIRKTAPLTITKEFAGEITEDEIAAKVDEITFTVLRDGEEMEDPIYLGEFEEEDGVYTITIQAKAGYEYELIENDADLAHHSVKTEIPDAQFLPLEGLTIAIKNTYTLDTHTVTYTDGVVENVFKDQVYVVKYGDPTPAFYGVPGRAKYIFKGWAPVVADIVTGDVTYVAQWQYYYVNPKPSKPIVSRLPIAPTVTPDKPDVVLETGDHLAYIKGYTDGTVHPNADITRAEAAMIFYRLLNEDTRKAYETSENSFTDVASTAWYCTAVSTLTKAGILNGYPDGSFKPNNPITRAEMATIIAKFADLSLMGENFTDTEGHWAETNIRLAAGNGWINGYSDGTFKPNAYITRAETVTMINRVLKRVPQSENDLLERNAMITFTDNLPGTWYYIAIQEAANDHEYVIEDDREVWKAED